MSNLKRHFNFNGKQSLSQESFASSKSTFNNFDKITLMNDIFNCLDLCSSYIQALNSLCNAGSSLAKNLCFTVKEAPAYQNISLQFLSVWEEISKATAGASAAVKTETLMLLQEVLNSLELCSSDTNIDDIILNSFQAIGSCICSFIELQTQFSWSSWKSLSKLSKNYTSDPLKSSLGLQRKSYEKNASKININTDLNSTIKKHYSQLLCKISVPKVNESPYSAKKEYGSSSISCKTNVPTYQFDSGKSQNNISSSSIWSSPIWSTKNFSGSVPESDLDDVINLLSCGPAQQSIDKAQNKIEVSYPLNEEQMENIVDSHRSVSGLLHHSSSWSSHQDLHHNDSFCWNLYDPNISRNSGVNRSQIYENKFLKHWDSFDIQTWNASSTETNSSSDDASSQCLDSDVYSTDRNTVFNNSLGSSFKGWNKDSLKASKADFHPRFV